MLKQWDMAFKGMPYKCEVYNVNTGKRVKKKKFKEEQYEEMKEWLRPYEFSDDYLTHVERGYQNFNLSYSPFICELTEEDEKNTGKNQINIGRQLPKKRRNRRLDERKENTEVWRNMDGKMK